MVEGIGPVAGTREGFVRQSSTGEQPVLGTAVEKNSDMLSPEIEVFSAKVSKDVAQQAVDKLNKTMETYGTELRFKMHEKSGEYSIKIINPKDNSVIREIPPERVLNMVAYFKEMLGLMVDKFA